MSNSHLDWIWSRYTTSPDPKLGMQSLYQTCSELVEHVLQPSHIILSGGGFTLHPNLAVPLTDVIPAMDYLLKLAAKLYGLRSTSSLCQAELHVLTCTTGLIVPATQHQIIWNWVLLLDELHLAMAQLKSFRMGTPRAHSDRPSRMPQILSSLPPSLRVKLPKEFLNSHGIMLLPSPANTLRVCGQKAAFVEGVHRRRAEVAHEMTGSNFISAESRMYRENQKLTNPSSIASDTEASILGSTTYIACKKCLEAADIVDRGVDTKSLPLGQFGLQTKLFQDEVVTYRPSHATTNPARSSPLMPISIDIAVPGSTTAQKAARPKSNRDALSKSLVGKRDDSLLTTDSSPSTIQEPVLITHGPVLVAVVPTRDLHRDSSPSALAVSADAQSIQAPAPSLAHVLPLTKPPAPSLAIANAMKCPENGESDGVPPPHVSSTIEPGGLERKESRTAKFPSKNQGAMLLTTEGISKSAPLIPAYAPVIPPGIIGIARMGSLAVETRDKRQMGALANEHRLDICADFMRSKMSKAKGLKDIADQRGEHACPRSCVRSRAWGLDYGQASARLSELANGSEHTPGLDARGLKGFSYELLSQSSVPASAVELGGPKNTLETRTDQQCEEEHMDEARSLKDQAHACSNVDSGIRSRSQRRDNALRITLVTPSPKSPAPALAIANAVELGGPHVEMEETRAKTSAGNIPRVRRPTDLEGLVVDSQVKLGEQDGGPPNQHTEMMQQRTSDSLAHVSADNHPPVLYYTVSFAPPVPSISILARSSVMACKIFALVSTIIQRLWISYLGCSLGGEHAPCIAWAREGIGTALWISFHTGADARKCI
ncbi:hypothetical protein B0H13DRAFT_1934606 [Mycena leptocephala]|nr:hypothetical protein B0H13DRAFT_1934606 [Mycena leptocephala]